MEETMDLLETIDVCYKEYKTRLDNYESIRDEYYSTEKYEYINKHPLKVVTDQDQIIVYKKEIADIELRHKLLLSTLEQASELLTQATRALKDAIPIQYVWFQIHDGFIMSGMEIKFVSFAELLDILQKGN
ncbi:MAG: hypothetical protein ABFD50_02265 [Smithella sp.]